MNSFKLWRTNNILHKMVITAVLCLVMGGEGTAYAAEPNAELSSPNDFPLRVYEPPQDPDPSSILIERPESLLDPLLQPQLLLKEQFRAFSPPDLNFPGIPFQGGSPPDTVGEVGSNHYIQMTNASVVQIYDKSGVLQAGPFDLDSEWTIGGPCANGRGDPIVLYDEQADRWLMSEFASTGNHLCVYISRTNDPVNGGWYNYDFVTPNFPDYPKYAVWPDAYYVGTNEPNSSPVYALDRTNMLAGNPASPPQRFTAPDLAGFGFQILIPSDLDGPPPPVGSPNFFMRHRDDEVHNAGLNDPTQDFLEIWAFSVDWVTPANSTFIQLADIPVAEFDSELCGLGFVGCFPQPPGPGVAALLDPLREVIMWRLQYRNLGTHETLVGNFVTDITGTDQGGIRWFDLRRTPPGVGAWALFQEGTYSPDTDNRFMGSIAMDRAGNIALGYSVSSAATFPSIRYTGRLASNPLGTMPLGEVNVITGMGSQTPGYCTAPFINQFNTCVVNTDCDSFVGAGDGWCVSRWGDYSSMNVDPIDGCTFWYTNEYVDGTGQWDTQIARFDIPGCINPFKPVIEKDYRFTGVCFEKDNDMDGEFNEDPENYDQLTGMPIDDDGDGLYNEDDTECPDGTDLGTLLSTAAGPDSMERFVVEAVLKKNGKVAHYIPGQYYAVSTIDILSNIHELTIWEDYSDCVDNDLSVLNPPKGGGSVVIVMVGPDGIAKQIMDANSPNVTVADGTAQAHIMKPILAGTKVLMYVKFGPGLKNMTVPLFDGNTCINENSADAQIGDTIISISATADLMVRPKQ